MKHSPAYPCDLCHSPKTAQDLYHWTYLQSSLYGTLVEDFDQSLYCSDCYYITLEHYKEIPELGLSQFILGAIGLQNPKSAYHYLIYERSHVPA